MGLNGGEKEIDPGLRRIRETQGELRLKSGDLLYLLLSVPCSTVQYLLVTSPGDI